MKKMYLGAALFLLLSCVNTVQAQVVDMRAYSRQKGFKAYKAAPMPAPVPVTRKTTQSAQSQPKASEQTPRQEQPSAAPTLKSAEAQKQETDEMRRYIRDNPQVIPDV